jgi:hypothetical protein
MTKTSTIALASALALSALMPSHAAAQWRGGWGGYHGGWGGYRGGWGGYHAGWGGYRGGWGYGGWGAGLAAGLAGLAIGSALAAPAYGYGYGYGAYPYYAPTYAYAPPVGYGYAPAYAYAPGYGGPVVIVRRVYRPYIGYRQAYWHRPYYRRAVVAHRAGWHGARRSYWY